MDPVVSAFMFIHSWYGFPSNYARLLRGSFTGVDLMDRVYSVPMALKVILASFQPQIQPRRFGTSLCWTPHPNSMALKMVDAVVLDSQSPLFERIFWGVSLMDPVLIYTFGKVWLVRVVSFPSMM